MALSAVDDDSGLSEIMCTEQFNDFTYLSSGVHQTCFPSNDVNFYTALPSNDVNYHAYLPNANDGQLSDVLGNFNLQSSDEIILNCCEDGDILSADTVVVSTDPTPVDRVSFGSRESPNKSTDHVMYSSDSAIDSSDHVMSGSEHAIGDSEYTVYSSDNAVDISKNILDSTGRLDFSQNVTENVESGLDRSCGSLMDISNSDIFNPAQSAFSESKAYSHMTQNKGNFLMPQMVMSNNVAERNFRLPVSQRDKYGNHIGFDNRTVAESETIKQGGVFVDAEQHGNKRMKLEIVTDFPSPAAQRDTFGNVHESNNNTTQWNQNNRVDTRHATNMPQIKQEILSPNSAVQNLIHSKNAIPTDVIHAPKVLGVITKMSPETKAPHRDESANVKPSASNTLYSLTGKTQVPMRSILQVNLNKGGGVAFKSQHLPNKRTPQKVLIPQHKLVKVKSSTAYAGQAGSSALLSGSKLQTVKYLIPVKIEPNTSSSSVVVPTLHVKGQGQINGQVKGQRQVLASTAGNSLANLDASNALKMLHQQSTMRKLQSKAVIIEGLTAGAGQSNLRSILAKPSSADEPGSNPLAFASQSNHQQPPQPASVNGGLGAKQYEHVRLHHSNCQDGANSSSFRDLSADLENKVKQAQENKFVCAMCKQSFALNRILLRTGGLYMQGKPQYCINCWEIVRIKSSP